MTRSLGRGLAIVAGALLPVLLGATPAAAHVSVSVEPARAGASDAVVTFTAEAESGTAGIAMLQVQLPAGIGPGDVAWMSGPPGWALTPANDGYSVSGPPLPVGAEARYAIKVKQLPDEPTVAFKTVQTYTDGSADRWIELPTPGGAEPANPAPIVTLSPGAANPAPTTPPPSSEPTAPPRTEPADPAGRAADDDMPSGAWWGLAALAAAIAAAVVLVLRRRARGTTED